MILCVYCCFLWLGSTILISDPEHEIINNNIFEKLIKMILFHSTNAKKFDKFKRYAEVYFSPVFDYSANYGCNTAIVIMNKENASLFTKYSEREYSSSYPELIQIATWL